MRAECHSLRLGLSRGGPKRQRKIIEGEDEERFTSYATLTTEPAVVRLDSPSPVSERGTTTAMEQCGPAPGAIEE